MSVSDVERADRATPGLSPSMLVHAVVALGLIAWLNHRIAHAVPFSVKKIEQSYLIFYYHLPSALSCSIFFAIVLVGSIQVLRTGSAEWDRRAVVAGRVGVAACAATLASGSTWASAAWNTWWDWGDPRLMTAAIMFFTYAGYVLLHAQVEDPVRRRRFGAIYGILAFVNIPLTKYAIEWFGATAHPAELSNIATDEAIVITKSVGVLAFFTLYCLFYRWALQRERTKDRLRSVLTRVRAIEEGAAA